MKNEVLEAGHAEPRKKTWNKPTLTVVGKVRNLAMGWGKAGSNLDNDPHSPTAKSGGG